MSHITEQFTEFEEDNPVISDNNKLTYSPVDKIGHCQLNTVAQQLVSVAMSTLCQKKATQWKKEITFLKITSTFFAYHLFFCSDIL